MAEEGQVAGVDMEGWDVSREAYPQWKPEKELLKRRRGGGPPKSDQVKGDAQYAEQGSTGGAVEDPCLKHQDLLGVGVSGGGVRSATFALGVFQALAAERSEEGKTLLEDIDFLSTVSGGGYFGGFYGSLFLADRHKPELPEGEKAWESVRARLSPDSEVIRFLRENGAYLAPAGPGDLMLGLAVLARNWVAVMLVLVSLIVAVGLATDLTFLFLCGVWAPVHDAGAGLVAWGAQYGLLMSPLFLVAGVIGVVWLLPLGCAYFSSGTSLWQAEMPRLDFRRVARWGGALVAQWVAAAGAIMLCSAGHAAWGVVLAIVSGLAIVGRTCGDCAGSRQVLVWRCKDLASQGAACAHEASKRSLAFAFLGGMAFVGGALGFVFAYGPSVYPEGPWIDLRELNDGDLWVVGNWAGVLFGIFLADVLLQLGAFAFDLSGKQGVPSSQTAGSGCERLDVVQYVNHRLSAWLKDALVWFLLLVAAGVVHTLACTIYAHSLEGVEGLLGVGAALLSALATGARRLVVSNGKGPDGKRPHWVASLLQYVAGGAALLVVVVLGLVLAQRIFFQAQGPVVPSETGHWAWARIKESEQSDAKDRPARQGGKATGNGGTASEELSGGRNPDAKEAQVTLQIQAVLVRESSATDEGEEGEKPWFAPLDVGARVDADDHYLGSPRAFRREVLGSGTHTLLGLFGLLVLLGGLRRFLNNSTHLALYSARITRTFLGATNRRRVGVSPREQKGVPPGACPDVATHLIPGDDLHLADYFRQHDAPGVRSPFGLGAPIHLINVTINETIDGRSQTQQADRRGVGMAIGPCGLSVGVRHHAVFEWDKVPEQGAERGEESPGNVVEVYPRCPTDEDPSKDKARWPHQVFGLRRDKASKKKLGWRRYSIRTRKSGGFPGERLSLGQWLGISGAAFTTGLGSRTNIGLSLLLGLTNVRLGYWWLSGVLPEFRWSIVLGWMLWVQQYLLRELFARFSGTADRLWYLSDGGHFENLGGYELVRRRLKKIVIIDAEADPDRSFDGLGNLIRKARLDFGAEIEFLDTVDLEVLSPTVRSCLGPLRDLKPGERGWSGAHAALARVTYPRLIPDDAPETHGQRAERTGWLLYIKPSLSGTEPGDLLQYHSEHDTYPHEPTSDQFFDEAQWESYRGLGELIGRRLFEGGTLPFSPEAWREHFGKGQQLGVEYPRNPPVAFPVGQ